jgi:hypothetical protein
VNSALRGLLALVTALIAPFAISRAGGSLESSVFDHPYFKNRSVPCLTVYLKVTQPSFTGSRTFFISTVQTFEDGSANTNVFDPSRNHIVLWEPYSSPACDDLLRSRRDWDLQRDVRDDIQGSTYLLSRLEAKSLKARYLAGDRVTITLKAGRFSGARVERR